MKRPDLDFVIHTRNNKENYKITIHKENITKTLLLTSPDNE